jgi:hypothetical protein
VLDSLSREPHDADLGGGLAWSKDCVLRVESFFLLLDVLLFQISVIRADETERNNIPRKYLESVALKVNRGLASLQRASLFERMKSFAFKHLVLWRSSYGVIVRR